MTSLLGKSRFKLGADVPRAPPRDEDFIRNLDYEELEQKYQIRKYYPRFIHNYDCSTPQIKALICNKPIYSKVNRANAKKETVAFNPDTGDFQNPAELLGKTARKSDRTKKKELRHERLKEHLEMKREQRDLRGELRDQHRQERREEREETRRLMREFSTRRKKPTASGAAYAAPCEAPAKLEVPPPYELSAETTKPAGFSFKNPFDSGQTLVGTTLQSQVSNKSNAVPEKIGRTSISEKLMKMVLHKHNEDAPKQRNMSFDQTKSTMTSARGVKTNLMRLNDKRGRGMSETAEVVTESVNNGHTGQSESIQYTQSQMVGHGSFGVVFQTQLLPSNEIAAIKRVLQDKRFKNRELQIMKLVHHRNIVDLKYYFYTNNEKSEVYLNLILEFVPETLYKASHYYVSKRLSMPALEVKLYTYQMFRALNYIHSQGICHRDIKPQNLLINAETGVLKLCDFGSAKILNPAEPNVSYICSRYYRAPELIFGATNYTTKIDVWSAACVMAELIVGQPLFPGESGVDQLVEIIKILGTPTREQIKCMNPNYTEYKFPQIKPIPLVKIFKKMSPDCINFLARVLEYSPEERISCIEALSDPYFDELRQEGTKLPNYRKLFSQQFYSNSSHHPSQSNASYQMYSSQPDARDLPELFDFDDRELSMDTSLHRQMIPEWALPRLKITRGTSLDDFVPMSFEEMQVTLE